MKEPPTIMIAMGEMMAHSLQHLVCESLCTESLPGQTAAAGSMIRLAHLDSGVAEIHFNQRGWEWLIGKQTGIELLISINQNDDPMLTADNMRELLREFRKVKPPWGT